MTIRDIAKMAQVSPSTVSKVFNGYGEIGEETAQKIYDICNKVGYTPSTLARNLAKRSSNMIGFLVPDISIPIYPEIFKGADLEARKHGCNLFLCDTHKSEDIEAEYIQELMGQHVKGIIVSPVSHNIEHIQNRIKEDCPIVYFGGKVSDQMDHYIYNDNHSGARIAIQYLSNLGHKHIAMIVEAEITKTKQDRINGYEAAMQENGLTPCVVYGGKDLDGIACGYDAFASILKQSPMPTAIFAYTDLVAIGTMKAAQEMGFRIPEDLSLVGYDDVAYASLPNIDLTTIAQPKCTIGAMAVDAIFSMISNGAPAQYRKIASPELIIRRTCRKL